MLVYVLGPNKGGDVTENAPRCNHRKQRQDLRSHEGGFLSARHTKRHCTATRMKGLVGPSQPSSEHYLEIEE
ncbi:hypothetical protein SeLEV6574_g01595 [Synchytrium endobioticum]|uniref:Uncharacterized protein n=1 Tax=Synchytrium endobioticum TaxID=286115 RepID=A0A507DEB4_9FUNG|nr:hypothetical protein SeLEV6574_g01595 [Synchytrium endobioticum]